MSSSQGKTALMFGASRGHAQVIRLLLKRGADPNRQDTWGLTALGHVVTGRLSHIKTRTASDWHRTALALIRYGNADVNLLSQWPSSWDNEDSFGQGATPDRGIVELAFRAGYEDLVRPFTIAGASPRSLRNFFSVRTQDLPDYVRRNTVILDWMRRYFRSPRPLRELARRSVRSAIGGLDFEHRLDSIKLAPGIRSYLMYADLVEKVPGCDSSEEEEDGVEGFDVLDVDDKLDLESDTEKEMEPSVFDSDLYGGNEPLDSDDACC
jgi:hypothetical protein